MTYWHYDRLTALDDMFLDIEDHNVHMHVGCVGIFEAQPLRAAHGGLDTERIWQASEGVLTHHPRFRQKLAYAPLFNHPVWVDDERFNLTYHVRHTALPPPGDLRQLKRLTGRIMSQQLDRGKPLWELWFVEGLENDRFAVISKLHHCMIDGASGVDLMAALMQPDRDATPAPPGKWIPRPAPSPARLLVDEAVRRAMLPLKMVGAAREALADPGKAFGALRDAVEGIGEAAWSGLAPASRSPLNPDLGPHRRFDWTRFDLNAVKEVKNRLGGTINDVVLAVVSGAVRRFLVKRGERPEQIKFRAMVPVNIRPPEERGALGNRVSFLLARLPIDERDPRRRLQRVCDLTHKLKASKQTKGAEIVEEIADWTFDSLFVSFSQLAARMLSYNMVVTNVPGPQWPVYLLGAPLHEIYPLVPLFTNQALGIALFSYDGGLFWGFNADWDAIPDLHDMVTAVDKEFAALRRAAGDVPVPIAAARAVRPPAAPRLRKKPAARAARRVVGRTR